MHEKMNKMFDQIHNVPKIPEVVRELITQFNDPKFDVNAVAKNIEKEQVIALKILRLVNSAHFGLSRKVGSIPEAVVMLGANQLRTLVIASAMVNSVPKIENINIKHFWEDSFKTATYAKWLAAETGNDADLAFTTGLISNLGTILVHMGAPLEASEIDQHLKGGNSRSEIEMRRLGFTSEAVCAELCKRWRMSDDLVAAVAQCGDPLTFEQPSATAILVNISRYISQACREGLALEEISGNFPYPVAAKLGLTEQFITDKLPAILAIESGLNGLAD